MTRMANPGDLEERFREASGQVRLCVQVRQEVEAQGALLRWARALNNGLSALRFQTPERLQRRFAMMPELLFLVCDGHLQVAHTRDGVPRAARSDRTTPSFAFWADPKPDLASRLQTLTKPSGTWLAWNMGASLESLLGDALRRHDTFDFSSPVRASERFGRERLLTTLQRDLDLHDALGVYGLRKVGKTSLVYGLEEVLPQEPSEGVCHWRVAYVDVQSYLQEDLDAVCEELLQGLHIPRGTQRSARVTLKKAVEHLVDEGVKPCVIIDEFDYLLTHRAFQNHVADFLAMIRGLVQNRPGLTKWVLVGREPSLLNAARLHGQPNPTLNFFREFWVPPLGRQEMGTMLATLGRRMGLDLGHQSKDRAHALTLGHPMMARRYGSQLARLCAGQSTLPDQNQPTDSLAENAGGELLRDRQARAWVAEVAQLLFEHHVSAGSLLLRHITQESSIDSWQELRASSPDDAVLLVDFGLVDDATGAVPGLLKAHLPRHHLESAA